MPNPTAFYYSDGMLNYQFGPDHPSQPIRYRLIKETLENMGVFGDNLIMLEPKPADISQIERVHSPEYIERIRAECAKGHGYLDDGDTPATKTLFDGTLACVGGTLEAVRAVAEGRYEHALNPSGGFHHARPDGAAGFSVFNDVAIAVRMLQQDYGFKRIAVIDTDGHHGDGTQSIFYEEKVLTISFHRFGNGFFPSTGSIKEIGKGDGCGYCINVPLPCGTQDEVYVPAFRKIVTEALREFKPDFILHVFGTDAHRDDDMVRLGLTTKAFERMAETTHHLAHHLCGGRYVLVGGGGYNLSATRRSWAIAACVISGSYPDDPEGLHHLQDPCIYHRTEIGVREADAAVRNVMDNVLPMMRGAP